MSTKTPPPSPRLRPRAPWRVDGAEVGQGGTGPVPAVESAPIAPPPPGLAQHAGGAPSDAAERIRANASRGGSLKALPALFGVTTDQFKGWMDQDPGLRKAFDEGKELEREALHRTLYEAAIYKRDLPAAQFLLKTRHGYREQEPEDNRNSVRVIFNIPAAAPDLKTYVEHNGRLEPVALPRAPRVIEHD